MTVFVHGGSFDSTSGFWITYGTSLRACDVEDGIRVYVEADEGRDDRIGTSDLNDCVWWVQARLDAGDADVQSPPLVNVTKTIEVAGAASSPTLEGRRGFRSRLDAGHATRVLAVRDGARVTGRHLVLARGAATGTGAGVLVDAATLILSDSVVAGNALVPTGGRRTLRGASMRLQLESGVTLLWGQITSLSRHRALVTPLSMGTSERL